MKSSIQKSIAVGIMGLGAVLGLWISSARGPQAKAQEGATQSSDPQALPPPQEFNPQDFQTLPPEFNPQDPQQAVPEGAESSAPPNSPEDFSFRTVNPEGFIYNPEGLRDPFFQVRKGGQQTRPEDEQPSVEMEFNPQDPLQAYPLNEYRLVGVLWDVREPRAMVLTPNGKVYSVRRKIRLGREGAVVAAVRESEVVVVQPNPDGTYVNASTRVISMKK